MISIQKYSPEQIPSAAIRTKVVEFLSEALEQYGDPVWQIEACLGYALSAAAGRGGLVLTAQNQASELIGVVIINHTNMKGYIPEHILVYIAVSAQARGKGVGKALMAEAIEQLPGSIALHVESDNPAKFLYEKLGFTNKYLEMRLNR